MTSSFQKPDMGANPGGLEPSGFSTASETGSASSYADPLKAFSNDLVDVAEDTLGGTPVAESALDAAMLAAGDGPDPLELASLLCSKVCHDVVNSVGAISNGLEVLDDDPNGDMHDVALDLIRSSATQASAKLQFARMAYGASSSGGSTIDLGDAAQVTAGFLAGQKIKVEWNLPSVAVPKDEAKLILNMILVAMATIPRGGVVTLEGSVGAAVDRLEFTAIGTNSRIPDDVEAHVLGRTTWSDVNAHDVQPYFTGLIAARTGLAPVFEMIDGGVRITVRKTQIS
ncbi:MAG: histidine phosphotransferase family protein [Pseudomonadota bacterium]